ncbi:hypothetical protein ACH0BW_04490 [Micrococcus luteus]|uniref:hypothetical protein n=1 Tax=Micrococcus luteus TaxID=1270 RepID=UPI0038799A6E
MEMSFDAGSGAGGVHGVGVDLESSTRAQVRLYERLGFRETSPRRVAAAWVPAARE